MKYPIGIQTFDEIIEEDYVYIDKTKSLYDLVSQGKVYFLSRPRRFGKSLFLSTLKAFFEGKRELFKGLYIEDKIKEWKSYPVIHIAMSDKSMPPHKLEIALEDMILRIAESYEIELKSRSAGLLFRELIEKLSKRGKVVVLIDEYDKALISFIEETDIFEENRKILKSFYGILKDADPYLKFLFITGVSRFSKISLFSDLNNLTDISMDETFCDICGYAQQDMEQYFDTRIKEIAAQTGFSTEEMYEQIRLKYNGYNFNGKIKMYNPWSVLNFMRSAKLSNYWFETGTPYFLTTYAERLQDNVEGTVATKIELGHLNFQSENLTTLLYQTGYLTIDEEIRLDMFRLRHPNEEVSESFRWFLLAEFTKKGVGEMRYAEIAVEEALREKNAAKLQKALNPYFSNIPYHIFIKDKEAYYHSVLHLIFTLMHYTLRSEVSTNIGRIDTIIESRQEIWIVECKLNETAEIAFNQIITNHYAEQYRNSGKKIWGIGINFSSEEKKIDGVVIREIVGE